MSINFVNPLKLPSSEYGESGVRAGRLIYDTLQTRGYSCSYDVATKTITVLQSSNICCLDLISLIEPVIKEIAFFPDVLEQVAGRDLQFTLVDKKVSQVFERYTSSLFLAMCSSNKPLIESTLFDAAPTGYEFSILCSKFPEIAHRAVCLYPELAKSVESSLLILLTITGSEQLLHKLLDLGCKVNKPVMNATVLYHAIQKNMPEIAEKLIAAGICKGKAEDALVLAAQTNKLKIVRLLLKAGVNPNPETADGKMLLEVAPEDCQKLLKEFLLQYLLDTKNEAGIKSHLQTNPQCSVSNLESVWRRYPHLALEHLDVPNMCITCPFDELEKVCKESATSFASIIAGGRAIGTDECIALIQWNAELLHQTIKAVPSAIQDCEFLVSQILRIYSSIPNCEEFVLDVIAAGAKINEQYFYDAVQLGFYKVAALIFTQCKNIGTLNGDTALHVAIIVGQTSLVEVVLASSQNYLEVEGSEGRFPLQLAQQLGNEQIVRLIQGKMLYYAILQEKLDEVKALLALGVLTTQGFEALCLKYPELAEEIVNTYIATKSICPFMKDFSIAEKMLTHGSEEFFIKLMQVGLPVRAIKCDLTKTLLPCAIRLKLTNVALALIEAKVDLNTCDSVEGKSPLHDAIHTENLEVLTKLLKQGADVHAKTFTGLQPLHAAIVVKNTQAIEILLQAGASLCTSFKGFTTSAKMIITEGPKECLPLVVDSMPTAFKELIETIAAADLGCQTVKQLEIALKENKALLEDPFLLELALMLGSRELVKLAGGALTYEVYLSEIEGLVKKYPHNLADILDLFFEVDDHHYKIGDISLLTMSAPPLKSFEDLKEIPARLFRLKGVEKREIVVNKEVRTLAKLHEMVSVFVEKVISEPAGDSFTGAPVRGTNQFRAQYDQMKTYLSHVIIHLQQSEKKDSLKLYTKKVLGVARELATSCFECFVQYFDTSMTLYKNYCMHLDRTGSNAFLEQLQILRGIVIESMIHEEYVNPYQAVHAIPYMKRVLGAELQLRDRSMYVEKLAYDSAGFMDNKIPLNSTLLESFNMRYRPSVIVEHLISALAEESVRTQYVDWAKEHLKGSDSDNEALVRKKQALQTKENEIVAKLMAFDSEPDDAMLAQYKKELDDLASVQDVTPVLGFTYVQSVKDDMEASMCSWLQDNTLAIKKFPLIMALLHQNILKVVR